MTYLPVKVARVVNAAGLAFNVRLVRQGDHYGRETEVVNPILRMRSLVHDDPDPLVEFWDAAYEDHPDFTAGLGQLVVRYALNTLVSRDSGDLNLCELVPEWTVTAANVEEVLRAVTKYAAASAYFYYKRREAAMQELRDLVATYLEGSDDAPRAAELLAVIEASSAAIEDPSAARYTVTHVVGRSSATASNLPRKVGEDSAPTGSVK